MKNLRAVVRACAFFAGAGWMMFKIWVAQLFKGPDLERALSYRRSLLKWLLPFLGVHVTIYGELPTEPGLLLCNHRSYLDPAPLLRDLRALPVGKAEIAHWPIIGLGCKLSGIILVDRNSPEGRLKARNQMNKKLKEGLSIINYPEGTTYRGPEILHPKKGMFQDAALSGFIIYPIVIEYQSPLDAWVGDQTFVQHFFSRFGNKRMEMRLSYGKPMTGTDGKALMRAYSEWMLEETERIRKDWYRYEDMSKVKS